MRVRKHPAISGLSGREGGFPQAFESTPPSLTREGRAHRANTRNAAQTSTPGSLLCSLQRYLVEVSAITPVSGSCKGRLAWFLTSPAWEPTQPLGRAAEACRADLGRLNLRRDRRDMPDRGLLGKGPGRCGYRGPAAHRKTGQLTLRYIGSPDTVGVLLPGPHPPRHPRAAPSGVPPPRSTSPSESPPNQPHTHTPRL